jgi:hypothetical protein
MTESRARCRRTVRALLPANATIGARPRSDAASFLLQRAAGLDGCAPLHMRQRTRRFVVRRHGASLRSRSRTSCTGELPVRLALGRYLEVRKAIFAMLRLTGKEFAAYPTWPADLRKSAEPARSRSARHVELERSSSVRRSRGSLSGASGSTPWRLDLPHMVE